MANSLYFVRFRVTNESKNVHLMLSSEPLSQDKSEILGFTVGHRVQREDVKYGVLAITDPQTREGMKSDHPTIKALKAKLNVGDEIPGWKLGAPVTEQVTNEETGETTTKKSETLFWVIPA